MSYLRQALLLWGLTLVGFALYVLLFWIGAASSITILFYRGVALAVVVALIVGCVAALLGRRSNDSSLPLAAAAVSLAFNICFLVLLPVTVDRSVSVFLLSTIERRQDAGVDSRGLERAVVDDYVVNMRAVDRRIGEQRKSGNITVDPDGKIHLTRQGERFMVLSRVVARLFGTDPRFTSHAPRAAPKTPHQSG
jgi:hypothetical protein